MHGLTIAGRNGLHNGSAHWPTNSEDMRTAKLGTCTALRMGYVDIKRPLVPGCVDERHDVVVVEAELCNAVQDQPLRWVQKAHIWQTPNRRAHARTHAGMRRHGSEVRTHSCVHTYSLPSV